MPEESEEEVVPVTGFSQISLQAALEDALAKLDQISEVGIYRLTSQDVGTGPNKVIRDYRVGFTKQ